MITLDPRQAVRDAVSANPERPATAVILDTPDARMIVFRLGPGQRVAPHSSSSTVLLSVMDGEGFLSGRDGEQPCRTGDVVMYEPEETHGMRAGEGELHLLATITPRPGQRPAAPAAGAH